MSGARVARPFVLTLGLAGLSFTAAYAAPLDDVRASLRLEQRGQALNQLQAYLVGQPEDPEALFLKGRVLAEMGRTVEAQDVFLNLTQKFPQLPEPYNNLAALYARDRQLEKARDALQSAIRVRPDYPLSYQNLGDIYAAMARDAYSQARRLAPGDAVGRRDVPARDGTAAARPSLAHASAPPAQPSAGARSEGVTQAFTGWLRAWEQQDVEQYLDFYAQDFHPASGETRESWEAQRRQRLHKPGGIRLQVNHPRWTPLGSNRSRVVFGLQYSSGKMKVRSTKVMVWAWRDGRWQIESESAG